MDLSIVAVLKSAAVILTGGFGILGLLKDFNDHETHRVTVWGKVSLAGILISTLLGVAIEIKQAVDERAAKETTAEQTLALMKNTDATLNQIQRTFTTITDMRWRMTFVIPCEDDVLREFCANARPLARSDGDSAVGDPSLWSKWPIGPGRFEFHFSIRVFARGSPIDETLVGHPDTWGDVNPDLTLTQVIVGDKNGCSECANISSPFFGEDKDQLLLSVRFQPEPISSNGSIQSKADLAGATLVVVTRQMLRASTFKRTYQLLRPRSVNVTLRDGETLTGAWFRPDTEGPLTVRGTPGTGFVFNMSE